MQIASRIMGTGRHLPEKVVTNFDIMKMMETTDEFIVTRTGVRQRRHAAPPSPMPVLRPSKSTF